MTKKALILMLILALAFCGLVAWIYWPDSDNAVLMAPSTTMEPPDQLRPYIEEAQDSLLPERPQHPGQLDLEDLHKGMIVISVSAHDSTEILLLSDPYEKDGLCMFDFIWWENEKPIGAFVQYQYCNDSGLIEYEGFLQGWNPTNHLLNTGRSISTTDVDEILSNTEKAPSIEPKLPVQEVQA